MEFSSRILHWYYKNKRNLPWRASKETYKVWISEIILQQTRVAQGMDYYTKFVATFPIINDLAKAEEEEVLKLWQGLGYYSRARNIHFTAKYICTHLEGNFPNNYKELLKLKGIGPYTAAAISSICFKEKQAAVDGNVYRVLSRVFEIKTAINSSKGIKEFQNLADSLICEEEPGDYNQALMELGATVCTPKNTDCHNCPLQSICIGFSKNSFKELPVKERKTKIKDRFFTYYCIEYKDQILLKKREEKGIWQNLYDFPLEESEKEMDQLTEPNVNYLNKLIGDNEFSTEKINCYKHKLSHQHLHIKIKHIKTKYIKKQDKLLLVKKQELSKYPVPKPIEDFLFELN